MGLISRVSSRTYRPNLRSRARPIKKRPKMPVDQEKLKKMQAKAAANRVGGKGTARRKFKATPKSSGMNSDSQKLQMNLKKIANTPIDGIDEVNMFKDDGSVIHFKNPSVLCLPSGNTFTVAGANETKKISEMPQILNQLGLEGLQAWAKSAETSKMLNEMSGGMRNNAAAAKKLGLDSYNIASFDQQEEEDVE